MEFRRRLVPLSVPVCALWMALLLSGCATNVVQEPPPGAGRDLGSGGVGAPIETVPAAAVVPRGGKYSEPVSEPVMEPAPIVVEESGPFWGQIPILAGFRRADSYRLICLVHSEGYCSVFTDYSVPSGSPCHCGTSVGVIR